MSICEKFIEKGNSNNETMKQAFMSNNFWKKRNDITKRIKELNWKVFLRTRLINLHKKLLSWITILSLVIHMDADDVATGNDSICERTVCTFYTRMFPFRIHHITIGRTLLSGIFIYHLSNERWTNFSVLTVTSVMWQSM